MGAEFKPDQTEVLQSELALNKAVQEDYSQDPEAMKKIQEEEIRSLEGQLSETYSLAARTRDSEERRRIAARAQSIESRLLDLQSSTVTKEQYQHGQRPEGYEEAANMEAKIKPLAYTGPGTEGKEILTRGHNTVEVDKGNLPN